MTYEFTLVLSNVEKLTVPLPIALFKAGCGDARIGMEGGKVSLGFRRKAASQEEAVNSAVALLGKAGLEIAEVRVETSTGGGGE